MAAADQRLAGKTILVTGAGGFIGSHLTERLVGLGARTRVLVRYTSRGWPMRPSEMVGTNARSSFLGDRTGLNWPEG